MAELDLSRRTKGIFKRSIACIVMELIFVYLLTISMILGHFLRAQFEDHWGNTIQYHNDTTFLISAILFSLSIILIVIVVIMTIVDSILILATEWNNDELNSCKVLWGILGLVLLGCIATTIFASKAKKVYCN